MYMISGKSHPFECNRRIIYQESIIEKRVSNFHTYVCLIKNEPVKYSEVKWLPLKIVDWY